MQTQETNTLQELEELRSQYNDLKKEVDKQQIINDRLLQVSMKNDLRSISLEKWGDVALTIMLIPVIWFVFNKAGLRQYMLFLSVACMLAIIFIRVIFNAIPNFRLLSGETTFDFIKALKKSKERKFRSFRIYMSIIVVWAGCLVGEVIHIHGSDPFIGWFVPLLMVVGVSAGILIDIKIHNRIIGIYEGLILQMENKDLYVDTLK